MLIQLMNIQTEGLEAQVRRLAYRRRRDGDGGEEGEESKSPHSRLPVLLSFGVSGHMLNESSADLEQFMSRQMRMLSSRAHLIYLSDVQRPVSAHRALLFLSSLSLEPPH